MRRPDLRIEHGDVVLVADGRKYLFLRNEGDADYPDLQVEAQREQANPATRDQGSDQPGSAPGAGVGARRGGFEQTDFHQIEEDRFAAQAADMLKRRALKGDFDRLIIVAPPTTLGELRKNYHKEVEARLVGEHAKDLTGHTTEDIAKLVGAA